MRMKKNLFHIYIIVILILIINVLSKSFPRAEPAPNNSTDIGQTTPQNADTNTDANTDTNADTNANTNADSNAVTQTQTQIATPEPTNTESSNDVQKDNSDTNNEDESKKVKSHVDSAYGSIDIEYIPRDPKDNTKIHLVIYFSSIAAIIILVCVVHSLILIRPKIIEKRADKRRLKHLKNKKEKQGSLSNISEGAGVVYNKEKAPEERVNEESPDASMEYTSSTDCIINLDKNTSYNKKKSGEKKSFKKKL